MSSGMSSGMSAKAAPRERDGPGTLNTRVATAAGTSSLAKSQGEALNNSGLVISASVVAKLK